MIVCHCGYTKDDHYFKHEYQELVKVQRDKIERYLINALDYPITVSKKCGYNECKAEAKVHAPEPIDPSLPQEERDKLREKYKCLLEHVYNPVDNVYRNIRFILPEDSVCNKCGKKLSDHRKEMTHHFHTFVHIENLSPNDKVYIEDPEDEDRKIVYKYI
jgi:hypothetical protein